jgi:prepilin-type processing-associated H-X9-DG protein
MHYTQSYGIYDCPSIDNAIGMQELLANTDNYASEINSQWSRWLYVEYGVPVNNLFGSFRYSTTGGGGASAPFTTSSNPARLADLQSASKIYMTMDTDSFNNSSPHGNCTVTDWRSAPTANGETIPGARHSSAVNVVWADSHATAQKVSDPSDPYNTGMSSNTTKVNGWNYWNRYN